MNRDLLKSTSILVLAFALSACSKESQKKAPEAAASTPVVSDLLDTSFEASCDNGAASAVSNAAYDLTSCQLSSSQRTLISGIGTLKVEADYGRKAVRIRNTTGDIVAETALNEDGTFSAPLVLGERFSEVDGCPVTLDGLATGKVDFDAEGKVTKVDLNTAYNLAQIVDPSATVTSPLAAVPAAVPATNPAPAAAPAAAPAPAPAMEPAPAVVPAVTPGTTAAVQPDSRDDGRGDRDRDRDRHHGGKYGNVGQGQKGKAVAKKGSGKQIVKGKGGQFDRDRDGRGRDGRDGHDGHDGRALLEACVKLAPCTFNSHAALSCSR